MTSPFAVWLLPSYHANIFMTTLFAVIDPSLSVIESTYSTLVYDAIYTLEEHWDTMIDGFKLELCLKFTNLVNIGPTSRYGALISIKFSPFPAYRWNFYFQEYFKPHPDRAQELRKIEKGAEGWLKRVWPSLTVIKATFGCIYAAPVPKVCSI